MSPAGDDQVRCAFGVGHESKFWPGLNKMRPCVGSVEKRRCARGRVWAKSDYPGGEKLHHKRMHRRSVRRLVYHK